MTTVRIESMDTRGSGAVIEVYEKGVAGAADTLVDTRVLGSPANVAELSIGSTRFLVVRAPTQGEGKTIDNWSTTPAAPPGA